MDTLYFQITGVATTLDVELSMDNPWIIHGYIVLTIITGVATTLDVR